MPRFAFSKATAQGAISKAKSSLTPARVVVESAYTSFKDGVLDMLTW